MQSFKAFHLVPILISLVIIISLISVKGQITTPCTASMISSFTPCINYITGSSSNGTSPPAQSCCSSLKSSMGTSMDCVCLLITASVPIQLPINRTLALSLPQACNMGGGVPIQCKASGSPLAAPGPALLGPTPPPTASSPLSPRASKAVAAAAPAPQSGMADDLPPSPSVESEAPNRTTGTGRLTPSASSSSLPYVSPPSLLLIVLGGYGL